MLGDSFRDLEEDQKARVRYKDGEKSHIDLAPTTHVTSFSALYTHNLTIATTQKVDVIMSIWQMREMRIRGV